MNTLFLILHIVVTLALISVVLLQEGKDASMKALSGSVTSGDSFFNKNSGRTKAAMLSKLTTVLAILFLITTVVLGILNAA